MSRLIETMGAIQRSAIRVAVKREHAALVRAVKRLRMTKQTRCMPDEAVGYNMCVHDVLALLAKRKEKKG